LNGKPCQPYGSDLRIAVSSGRRHVYPDISVICGKVEFDPADSGSESVSNPTLIIEVLSPSTAQYDRVRKFDAYRQIASFQEYVLIEQNSFRIETFVKRPDGVWNFSVFSGQSDIARLTSIDVNLPLEEVFAGVEFPEPERPPS
jgi:Uma2 family endonuclease